MRNELLRSLKPVDHLRSMFLRNPALGISFELAFVACITLTLAATATFSTLAPYDDEGYCMRTVQTYLSGERLYGRTHTQYGPAYYQWSAAIHHWLNLPLTHTAVRLKTVAIWLVATVLGLAIVYRITRSHTSAIIAGLATAIHLEKLALEPSHPQELVLLGFLCVVSLMVAMAYRSDPETSASISHPTERDEPSRNNEFVGRYFWTWLSCGMIAGFVGFTKLNCGMLIAVPLVVAALGWLSNTRWVYFLQVLLASLPGLAIAWIGKASPMTVCWALWIAVAAAVWVVRSRTCNADDSATHRRQCLSECFQPIGGLLLGASLISIAIVAIALHEGVTVSELWFGLVGQHTDFAADFFLPLPSTFGAAAAVLAVIVLALYRRSNSSLAVNTQSLANYAILTCIVVLMATCIGTPLIHGLQPRGVGLFLCWFVPGYLGFVAKPASLLVGDTKAASLGAKSLAANAITLTAIMGPLIACPVPGTQVTVGTTVGLLLLIAMLSNARGRNSLDDMSAFQAIEPNSSTVLPFFKSIVYCLAIAAALSHTWRYASNTPLELAGSWGMRLPSEVAAEQKKLVTAIRETGAKRLVFEGHNNNRFYFWTECKPLTTATPTFWPRMLRRDEITEMQRQLVESSSICVVRVPDFTVFYDERTLELQRQLRDEWNSTALVGRWNVGVIEKSKQ